MNPLIANLLRLLLAMLGARLATRGLIEPGAESQFADYAVNAVGAVAALASVFSAFKSTRKQGELINTALALPAYSTPYSLTSASAGTAGGGLKDYLIVQALNTTMATISDELRRAKYRALFIRLRDALNVAFPVSN